MKRVLLGLTLAGMLWGTTACVKPEADANADGGLADRGIVAQQSPYSVEETANRLVAQIEQRGLTLFAQIDHETGARSVDLDLRPTQLVIFGNPRVGTPLMQCNQGVAIDLPQKALIWEDETGQVWLGYNNPNYLMERHTLTGCETVIERIEGALSGLTSAAIAP
ncbi:MAG: DUF302 domain-containing protein [Leptolyngbyaceae cyanobacterium MO_188.B28]|nr:DUF302 domain-containing protein [Leptolyngbyaceae cyanobacterium MO_188.B28]